MYRKPDQSVRRLRSCMKRGSITRYRLRPKSPPKTDWRAFDAMSEEKRHQAALSDPDAQLATEVQLAYARRTPRLVTGALVRGREETMSFWNAELQQLMDEALVPGAAAAIVRDGHLAEVAGCGVRHVRSPLPVDAYTVFDAASLSKPVFAYLVLQLVDQGKLKLDTLLADHLQSYIVDDPRAASITSDHMLSHSACLPNWRNLDYPLRTYFQPGERFSYSGEGFLYLQRVIEAVAGERLDGLAQSLVFGPLGMNRSSF